LQLKAELQILVDGEGLPTPPPPPLSTGAVGPMPAYAREQYPTSPSKSQLIEQSNLARQRVHDLQQEMAVLERRHGYVIPNRAGLTQEREIELLVHKLHGAEVLRLPACPQP